MLGVVVEVDIERFPSGVDQLLFGQNLTEGTLVSGLLRPGNPPFGRNSFYLVSTISAEHAAKLMTSAGVTTKYTETVSVGYYSAILG
jgi:hypothetical protein